MNVINFNDKQNKYNKQYLQPQTLSRVCNMSLKLPTTTWNSSTVSREKPLKCSLGFRGRMSPLVFRCDQRNEKERKGVDEMRPDSHDSKWKQLFIQIRGGVRVLISPERQGIKCCSQVRGTAALHKRRFLMWRILPRRLWKTRVSTR